MSAEHFVNGEDVHFDYSQPVAPNATQPKKKKNKNKKRKKSSGNAAALDNMEVELNDENAEYPTSRVLKLQPNGDLLVTEYNEDAENDSARFEAYDDIDDSQRLNQSIDNVHEYHNYNNASHPDNNQRYNNTYDDDNYECQDENCPNCHSANGLGKHNHCNNNNRHLHHSHNHDGYSEYGNEIDDERLIDNKRSLFESLWDDITSPDERVKIQEFWNNLPADRKKQIVHVEKDEILRSLRDEQGSGCNCKICGNKKISVESEIEKVYNEFYLTFLRPITRDFKDDKGNDWPNKLKDFLEVLLGFQQMSDVGGSSLTAALQTSFIEYASVLQEKASKAAANGTAPSKPVSKSLDIDSIGELDSNNELLVEAFAQGLLGQDCMNFMDIMLQSLERKRYDRKDSHIIGNNDNTLQDFPGSFVEDQDDSTNSHSHSHSHNHNDHGHSHSHSHMHHDGAHRSESDYDSEAEEYEDGNEEYDDEEEYEEVEEEDEENEEEDVGEYEEDEEEYEEDDDEYDHVNDGEYSNEEEYMDYDDEEVDEEKEERGRIAETFRMLQLVSSKVLHRKLMKAYKSQAAEESSRKLLEELQMEEQRKKEKQEKEKKKREKLKEKKRLQQLAKEEERRKKEEEKLEQERLQKEEQMRKMEEGRKKKEAERKKREEEKKKRAEAERKKKEAEQERLRKEKEKKEQKKLEEKKRREEEKKMREEELQKKEQEKLLRKQKLQEEKERELLQQKEEQQRLEVETVTASVADLPSISHQSPLKPIQLLQREIPGSQTPSPIIFNPSLNNSTAPDLLQQQQSLNIPPLSSLPPVPAGNSNITEDQLTKLLQRLNSMNINQDPHALPQQASLPGPPGFASNGGGFNNLNDLNLPSMPVPIPAANGQTPASQWNFDNTSSLNSNFNTNMFSNGTSVSTANTSTGPANPFNGPFASSQVPSIDPGAQLNPSISSDISGLPSFINEGRQSSFSNTQSFGQPRKSINAFSNQPNSSLLQKSSFFGNDMGSGIGSIGGVLSDSSIWGSSTDAPIKPQEPNSLIWGSTTNQENQNPTAPGLSNNSLWFTPPPSSGMNGLGGTNTGASHLSLPNNSLMSSSFSGPSATPDVEKIQLEAIKSRSQVPSENSSDYSVSLLYHQTRQSLSSHGDPLGDTLSLEQFVGALSNKLAPKLGYSFEFIYDKMGHPYHVKIINKSTHVNGISSNGLNGFDNQRLSVGSNPLLSGQSNLLPFAPPSNNSIDNWVPSGFRSGI